MIDKLFNRTARVIELVLALAFLFAILLNFTNVIGRYVFGRSLLWADEVQIFIMIAMTFIGAVVVTWRRAHLRMDVLARMLPKVLQKLLWGIELVLMVVLCGFVMYQSYDYASKMMMIGRTSDTAEIPMWIPHGTLAVGFLLIVVIAVVRFLGAIFRGRIDDPVTERSEVAG